jgi:hypothetical protein
MGAPANGKRRNMSECSQIHSNDQPDPLFSGLPPLLTNPVDRQTGIERDGSASPIWGSVAHQMPRFTVSKSPNRETFDLPRVPGMPNTNSPKRDGEDTTTEALRLMQDMLASLEDIAASLHLPRLKKLLSEAKQEAADSAGL